MKNKAEAIEQSDNQDYVTTLVSRIAALEAELAAAQKRCDEAYGNVSALFGEFMKISGMTHLGGEVDDYSDVTKAVNKIVDDLAATRAERDIVIKRAVEIVEARRQRVLANPLDPSWTEHFAELENELRALGLTKTE